MPQIAVDINAKIIDILDVLDDQNCLYDLIQYGGRYGNLIVFDLISEVCLQDESST